MPLNLRKLVSVTGTGPGAYIGRIIYQLLSFLAYNLHHRCLTGSYIRLSNTPPRPAKIGKDIQLLNFQQIQVAGARLK